MKTTLVYRCRWLLLCLLALWQPCAHSKGNAGYALSFTAANSNYVSIPSIGSLTSPFTVEIWVKLDALPAVSNVAGFVDSRPPQEYGFDIKYDNVHHLVHGDIGNGTGFSTTSADASATFQTNVWHHIAYVVTSTNYAVYLDGDQAGSGGYAASSPLLFDANHPLLFGVAGNGEYMTGKMDEVRIWNVARTATEISLNKNRGLRGDEPGLVQYYKFDEGSGSTIGDSVSAGGFSTGNLVNGTVFVPSDLSPFTLWAPSAPLVSTLEVDGSVGILNERFQGTITPNGSNTTGWFEWGIDTNYGNITLPQTIGDGITNVGFSTIISNLTGNTIYHVRAVASNVLGVVTGEDKVFVPGLKLIASQKSTNTIALSWLMTAPAYVLEQTTNIESTNWTTLYGATVTNGNYLTLLPKPAATMFYRLRKIVNGPVTPLVIPDKDDPDDELPPVGFNCPTGGFVVGCLVSRAWQADFDHWFDASGTVDPNRRPNDPPPAFHWRIYFPQAEGGAQYSCRGITGYFAPVLAIQPSSLPALTGPANSPTAQWIMQLTVTHGPINPLVSGMEDTVYYFQFRYVNSQGDLSMCATCQNPAAPPGDCTLDVLRPTTEPH